MCCLMIYFIHGEQASKRWREETQIQVLVSRAKKHTGGGGRSPQIANLRLTSSAFFIVFCCLVRHLICFFTCVFLRS